MSRGLRNEEGQVTLVGCGFQGQKLPYYVAVPSMEMYCRQMETVTCLAPRSGLGMQLGPPLPRAADLHLFQVGSKGTVYRQPSVTAGRH